MNPRITRLRLAGLFALAALLAPSRVPAQDSVFGKRKREDAALIGMFYDFKQDQAHVPRDVDGKYLGILEEFMAAKFDEKALDKYFRATRPLYATRIWMPRMSAAAAPKAFGVEGIVEPRHWIAQYKGQVSPPTDGTFRFVGWSDDVLLVLLDGELVLEASRDKSRMPSLHWQQSKPVLDIATDNPNAQLLTRGDFGVPRFGQWMAMKKNKVYDIDVIVGERPGGEFYARLFFQQEGVSYPTAGSKTILPAFRTSDAPIEDFHPETNGPIWAAAP